MSTPSTPEASPTQQPDTKTSGPSAGDSQAAPTNESQVLGQYIPLIYHHNMLQDEDRVGAFREAINLVVRPGMHVVELGGGTGILSSFAAQRGARVTCVERNPELVSVCRSFVELNGLSDAVTVIEADASTFVPDLPVDVVVCEMLHVALLREKQAAVIDRFKHNYRQRFNHRESQNVSLPVFIPETSILMVQPVEQSFDFFGYQAPVPLFQAPILDQPRTIELAPLQPYASLAYEGSIPQAFRYDQPIHIEQPGYLNAIRFVTQNVLALDDESQKATTWANQCLVLPLPNAMHVEPSDELRLRFDYPAGGTIEHLQESISLTQRTADLQRHQN